MRLLRLCLLLVAMACAPQLRAQEPPPWVLVDTGAGTLSVIQGGRVRVRFSDIAIGRGGVTRMRMRDDDATPLGTFHIAWINNHSPFHRFFGFDYPNPTYAWRAFDHDLIGPNTVRRILRSARQHRRPPQDTPLGGDLGIHGLGDANLWIHRHINWTRGCIALTNRQIDALSRWVRIGTKVVVR